MKKTFLLFIVVCVLFSACTKQEKQENFTSPFRFYYKPADLQSDLSQGALPFEIRETEGHENDYLWILNEYFKGPLRDDLTIPFLRTTSLSSVGNIGGKLEVYLTDSFAELTGIDLTIACACITMTCLGFDDVESVSIRVAGHLLDDKPEILMSASNLIISDFSSENTDIPYTLYFSDENNRYLIGEEVTLSIEEENVPLALMNYLIDGPNGAGLAETMPVGTKVLGLGISAGICSVNFSEDFLKYAPHSDLAQRMTILSVANTLTQLDQVDAVAIYVDGMQLREYGSIELKESLTYEERAVGPARTGINELDLDLYLPIGNSQRLYQLPVRIQQTANESSVEKLLHALLEYRDQNGYHTPIPEGTEVLSVTANAGVCRIDFSEQLLVGAENPMAMKSICATVLASGFQRVEILIAGSRLAEYQWNPEWLE